MPAPTRTLIKDALRRSREDRAAGALALDLPAPAEVVLSADEVRCVTGLRAIAPEQRDFILRTIEAMRDGRIAA